MNDQVFQLLVDKIDTSEKNMCDRFDGFSQDLESFKAEVRADLAALKQQRWKAAGKAAAYGTVGGIISFLIGIALNFLKN